MEYNNSEMQEREINLVDMAVEILLHWRMIVLFMIIGGVLAGGFSYLQSARTVNLQAEEVRRVQKQQEEMTAEELTEQWEAQKTSMEESLEETQIGNVNAAIYYYQRYKEKLEYMQHSLLMNLDSYQAQQAELLFLVRAADPNQTYVLNKIYENLLSGTELYAYVQERCGIDAGVDELITLFRPEYVSRQESAQTERQAFMQEGQEEDIIDVRILHEDPTVCQAMADAVLLYLQEQQGKITEAVGNHELELLNRSCGQVTDSYVANLQASNTSDLYSLQSTYEKLADAFSDEELAYYNFLQEGNPAELSEENSENAETGEQTAVEETVSYISIKYVLIGIALFAFIYVCILFLSYILNNKLSGTESLQMLYGIPQLGVVPAVREKRFLSAVDEWILKLRYHGQRRFTPEESTTLAAVAVKMAAKKQGLEQIYFMGCNITGVTAQACDKMADILGKEGVEASVLNNVLYDAKAMECLADVEGVVLVETSGSTLYDEVEKELQLLCRQNIRVLGGIIVEGEGKKRSCRTERVQK